MMRCYLHPKRAPHLHAETIEQLEKAMIDGFRQSWAFKDHPEQYCEHGAYAGDTSWAKSCCLHGNTRCYETEAL